MFASTASYSPPCSSAASWWWAFGSPWCSRRPSLLSISSHNLYSQDTLLKYSFVVRGALTASQPQQTHTEFNVSSSESPGSPTPTPKPQNLVCSAALTHPRRLGGFKNGTLLLCSQGLEIGVTTSDSRSLSPWPSAVSSLSAPHGLPLGLLPDLFL